MMQRWLVAAMAIGGWVACSGTAVVDPGSGSGGSATTTSAATSGTSTTVGSSSSNASSGSTTSSGAGGSCNGPGQCVLTHPGCCPTCGFPGIDDLVPVPQDELAAYRAMQCPDPEPCPDCLTCTNGELFAHCGGGTCQKAHLDDFDLRACTTNEDCRLRWGADCYEPCGGIADCDGLTAVSVQGASTLATLVCDPNAPPPPPCVPTYPDNAEAICDAGRCTLGFLDD